MVDSQTRKSSCQIARESPMRCDFTSIEQTGRSYSINSGTDGSNSARIIHALQDPGSYLITDLRTSNSASSSNNDCVQNWSRTKSLRHFEHEAVLSAEPI